MAKKTGKQVQSDVMELLNRSSLPSLITGGVYRNGCRPKDSTLEDAIVIFTAGLTDEIQTGVVTVNIYVPDIDSFANGILVEAGQRCEELEIAAQQWVESLTTAVSDYRFKQERAICTDEEPDIHQHFIVIKLKYELLTT